MKAAFSIWNGRIAPVFDVSRQLIIVEIADAQECTRIQASFTNDNFQYKTRMLKDWGVRELICGAISRELERTLMHAGIATTSFVAGDIEEIISAFITGDLFQINYGMPGCRGCCRRNETTPSQRKRRRGCVTESEE